MNYAVIKTGGKQYKVAEGDVITVERLAAQPNENVTFSEVLLHTVDGKTTFGQPTISGFSVTGKVLAHVRGEKLRIAKYKAKVRYRRVTGHRQELSQIQIDVIGGHKASKVETPKVEAKAAAKPRTSSTTSTRSKKAA
jgi:large subunit ribosomal protein L21